MPFLQIPSAPLELTSRLTHHLTTTSVHETYFPYARFATLHAVRVSLVWAGMTRTRKRRVGYLHDLFGYLVIAWGGSTLTSLLLHTPPSWFLPTPWLIYPLIHFIFLYSPLPISRIIIKLIPSTILDIIGAYIDGITRGTTVSILSSSSSSSTSSTMGGNLGVWGKALFSGICISGGGWITQLLNLNGDEWALKTPAVLRDEAGILDLMDTWSAFGLSIIFSVITNDNASGTIDAFQNSVITPKVDTFIKNLIPTQYTITGKSGSTTPDLARAVVIVLMGSILSARVVTRLLTGPTSNLITGEKTVEEQEESLGQRLDVGGKSREGTPSKAKKRVTPKKSPKVKST